MGSFLIASLKKLKNDFSSLALDNGKRAKLKLSSSFLCHHLFTFGFFFIEMDVSAPPLKIGTILEVELKQGSWIRKNVSGSERLLANQLHPL